MLESVAGMTVARAVPVLITAVLLPLAQAAGLGCQWLNSELFGAAVRLSRSNLEKCSSKFSKCSGHTHRASQTGFWLYLLYWSRTAAGLGPGHTERGRVYVCFCSSLSLFFHPISILSLFLVLLKCLCLSLPSSLTFIGPFFCPKSDPSSCASVPIASSPGCPCFPATSFSLPEVTWSWPSAH